MAENYNPPEKELKQLIASYPYLSDLNPSSWLVWSDNEALPPIVKTQEVCHANMRWHGAGYDHLITAYPKGDKLSLKFFYMLITGPFRAFSDLINLKFIKNEGYYVQVDSLDKWPANVLFNFCIATRHPIEYYPLFERWSALIHKGYPEVLAYLLSYSTNGKPFKREREFPNWNHFFVDPSSDWRNVLDGTPNIGAMSFKVNPMHITPANTIWGNSEDYFKTSKMLDDSVARYFNIGLREPPTVKTERPRTLDTVAFYKQAIAQAHANIHDEAPVVAGGHINPQWANLVLQVNPAAEIPLQPIPQHAEAVPQPDDEDDLGDFDVPDFWDDEDDD